MYVRPLKLWASRLRRPSTRFYVCDRASTRALKSILSKCDGKVSLCFINQLQGFSKATSYFFYYFFLKRGGLSGWNFCVFSGDSVSSWWRRHTRWKWSPSKKSAIFFQNVKESISVFLLPLRSSPWLQCCGRSLGSNQGRRLPHALWLCRNGAVTSEPQSLLGADTPVLSRRQKPVNNVNDGSDLFGCPRKQQQWAIMHINCTLLGWSHYRSY